MINVKLVIWVALVIFITFVNARSFNDTDLPRDISTSNEKDLTDPITTNTDIGTSRKRHYYLPFYGGSAILGLGGLHALAVLYAIKVKIIVVVVVIALSIYYYSKIYLKSCQLREIIRDTNPYESFGPSGYSNSLPPGIGYPGTDRFNSVSFDHDDHHHHHDPKFVETESKASSSSPTDKTEMMSRVYNQMRQFTNPLFDNIDWSDMAFDLLGLDTDLCRRRFTCELDFRVKEIPFSSYMFNLDGPAFLNKYRELSDDVEKPTKFSDCAEFYGKCKYL